MAAIMDGARRTSGCVGIWGKPFLDLEPWVDTARFDEIHEEICLALLEIDTSCTGGSHKSMNIVPPHLAHDPYVDYGQVLASLSAEHEAIFLSLADPPAGKGVRASDYGEEKDLSLSRKQMVYLKTRFGVYFPWKVYYELIPNMFWSEKSQGRGKRFTQEALRLLPKTVAFIQSLPFREIGSCKLLGLEANDHGTIHRDANPAVKMTVDHFISFCPKGDKRFFLWDDAAKTKIFAPSRAYWFNDSDYHGVDPDPYFRYSLRVDGIFQSAFLETLQKTYMPVLNG